MLPIVALTLCVVLLLLKFLLLRHSIREVAEELDEKLKTDTNTLISISIGDQAVQTLAAQINEQLAALRRERLRLQNGDAELKAAVTNMSHDLRTPLTAICGYLDLLEREPHSDNSKRYLAVMRERTDAMCALTQELFQYSVITSAADRLILQLVCLNDLLEQCLAGFYGALTERGITPKIQMPEQAVIRKLDAAATRRVLENILSNAVKYSDGDLCVSLTVQGKVTFTNHAANLGSVQVDDFLTGFIPWKRRVTFPVLDYPLQSS